MNETRMRFLILVSRMLRILVVCGLTAIFPGQVCTAQDLHTVARELLSDLGSPNAPGRVLFSEDWGNGKWNDHWNPSDGWTVVRNPDGKGFCAKVVASHTYQSLRLKQPVPVEPGHPVAVFWRARLLDGSAPVWLSAGAKDAAGKSVGGRQEIVRQGREWTDCAVLVSDWYQATNARQFHSFFFLDPLCNTTALISDFKVVDLHDAAVESIRNRMLELPRRAEQMQKDFDRLPDTPVGGWWKLALATRWRAMSEELRKVQALDPASSEAVRVVLRAEQFLTRFQNIADGLRRGAVRHTRLAGFATRPIATSSILPGTVQLPDPSLDGMQLTACPGEFESSTLVLWAPEALAHVLPVATELKGPDGSLIPADHVQIKWVKCWWQSGSAPRGLGQDLSRKVLTPELLLNDDDLVRVDLKSQRNRVRLSFPEGDRYVAIDDPERKKAGFAHPLAEFPVRDSPKLVPADLPAEQNKQLWITVKVPPSARPGRYEGSLRFAVESDTLLEVPLSVEVLPFSLPAPRTHYDLKREYTGSIYYWGELDPEGTGSVGHKRKSERQFRAELELMRDHNLVAPTMIWSPKVLYDDEPRLRRQLAILRELGMSDRPLTTGDSGTVRNPTEPEALARLKVNVSKLLRAAADHGFTDVYFYGLDEAKGKVLHSQKPAWKAVREAGGKVMTSGSLGMVPEFGPILDLINHNMPAPSCEVAGWHHHGRLVWNYGNPQSAVEDPELFRRNYGLFNWRHDLDGTCTYCFLSSDGSPWNDFDFVLRNHSLAYPTADGAIGTVALAGLREGLDDVKYASALRLRIEKASLADSEKLKARASAAQEWLEDLDLNTTDLDEVRLAMTKRIRQLDQGLQNASGARSAQ
ncbi:MAG: hypothetical protein H8E66_00315 [Planctomycetes bacterium]|nr:hypothetical protein [Planctomycetota bacterium]